jgi:hypothetical protein
MPMLIVLLIFVGVTPLLGQENSSRAVLFDIVRDKDFQQVDGLTSADLRVRVGNSKIPVLSLSRASVSGRVIVLLDSSSNITSGQQS